MKNSQFVSSVVLGLILLFLSGCQTTTRVMVRAWAEDDYRSNLADGELPDPEHYMLVRGSFDSGLVLDNSLLEEKDFLELSTFLVDALSAQNYVLAKPSDSIDLLVVVHWGQTTIDSEYMDNFDIYRDENLRRNSLILGTAPDIYKYYLKGPLMGGSVVERLHAISVTDEERYYFVLIAYDAHDLAINRKKTVKWVTQFSVDTPGKNYLEALPSMTRVAQNYLGRDVDELQFHLTELGDAEVEFGEIEIVTEEG